MITSIPLLSYKSRFICIYHAKVTLFFDGSSIRNTHLSQFFQHLSQFFKCAWVDLQVYQIAVAVEKFVGGP